MTSLTLKPHSNEPAFDKTRNFEIELRSNIKELLKEFQAYSKKDLTYVLELCEYNLYATQHYLRNTSKPKIRSTIISFLNGEIEPSLESLGLGFVNVSNDQKEPSNKVEKPKEEVFIPTGPNYFEIKLTPELTHYVFDFLDPFTLGKIGLVCRRFNEISVHPLLYKKFCKKLFFPYPPLPHDTPFNSLLLRINSAPLGEFPPPLIAQANQDIRSLVWLPNLRSFFTPPSYYKQFKETRAVFLNAPRVKFGGVYKMKERYIRAGSKDGCGFYDPYHQVEFYRYFRFFPNGLILSSLSVNKIKQEKLDKIFSPHAGPTEEDSNNPNSGVKSIMHGEYIIQKSKIHIRLSSKTTIYEYELEIESSEPGLFDRLKMMSQSLRSLGSEHSQPFPNPSRGARSFKFVPVKSFLREIDQSVASVSC